MNNKCVFILFTLGVLFTQKVLLGQQIDHSDDLSKKQFDSTRNLYVHTGVGLLEIFNIGIGCQISPDIALSFIYSGTWIGYSSFNFPSSGTGIGIKASYFKKFLFFNNISTEFVSYLNLSLDRKINSVTKGSYFEITAGNENIEKSKLKIHWAIGVGLSNAHTVSTLFFPSLKIGINYNLF